MAVKKEIDKEASFESIQVATQTTLMIKNNATGENIDLIEAIILLLNQMQILIKKII